VTKVKCPECGGEFETEQEVLTLLNRFDCLLCDALLKVIEEEPLVLDVVDQDYLDSEDEEDEWDVE